MCHASLRPHALVRAGSRPAGRLRTPGCPSARRGATSRRPAIETARSTPEASTRRGRRSPLAPLPRGSPVRAADVDRSGKAADGSSPLPPHSAACRSGYRVEGDAIAVVIDLLRTHQASDEATLKALTRAPKMRSILAEVARRRAGTERRTRPTAGERGPRAGKQPATPASPVRRLPPSRYNRASLRRSVGRAYPDGCWAVRCVGRGDREGLHAVGHPQAAARVLG
jgi:hypothetical protein